MFSDLKILRLDRPPARPGRCVFGLGLAAEFCPLEELRVDDKREREREMW
jgi:hypothetical protein